MFLLQLLNALGIQSHSDSMIGGSNHIRETNPAIDLGMPFSGHDLYP